MLPIFLSRLNEINGGCERTLPVTRSFLSTLKFFRMMNFTAWLWGRNVRVNGFPSLFSFADICSADCRSICWARWWLAVTTEAGLLHLWEKSHISSDFKEKSESSLQRRRSLRNWEWGMGVTPPEGSHVHLTSDTASASIYLRGWFSLACGCFNKACS